MDKLVSNNFDWFRLDNAAKIFLGQNSSTWSNVFRVSVELNEIVDPEILEEALKIVLGRFACFDVCIKRGFFWYYFEKNKNEIPPINHDIKNPCHRVKFSENNRFLFRVYYHEKRISVDFFHALSDGYGNAVFASTLVAQYLRLKGYAIPCGDMVLDVNEAPKETEMEDAFFKNASSKAKYKRSDKFVYHAVGTKIPEHSVNITSGTLSFKELHKITKEKGVTVTEFIAAVMMDILYKKQLRENKKQKEISIQIPVNLRKSFGSETLRNFTICLRVKIDPNKGEYTFDDILKQVSLQLRLSNNQKEHNMMITANLGLERNPFLRLLPLVIKDIGIGISFYITGEQTTSSLVTNLGLIKVPDEMKKYVNKFIFMPGPGKLNGTRCGVTTFDDALVITFADIYEENDIEREFFTRLVKMGLHVKVESNRE